MAENWHRARALRSQDHRDGTATYPGAAAIKRRHIMRRLRRPTSTLFRGGWAERRHFRSCSPRIWQIKSLILPPPQPPLSLGQTLRKTMKSKRSLVRYSSYINSIYQINHSSLNAFTIVTHDLAFQLNLILELVNYYSHSRLIFHMMLIL